MPILQTTGDAVGEAESASKAEKPASEPASESQPEVTTPEPGSALSKIPHNEEGEPLFEEAESMEEAMDAILEFAGDEDSAQQMAEAMAHNAVMELEKLRRENPVPAEPTPVKPDLTGVTSPLKMRARQQEAARRNAEAREQYERDKATAESRLAEAERKAKFWAEMAGVEVKSEEEESKMSIAPERYDHQGNPIDENGNFIVETVSSVDEIADEEFVNPHRTVQLPELPKNVADAIGTNGKPVIIKKNIFGKNRDKHDDLTPEQSRGILKAALYTPTLYGKNQAKLRPANWILIHLPGRSSAVILEVDHNKDNCEIVNWHFISPEAIERKKRRAIEEGGRILTLESAVANTQDNTSSDRKDNTLQSDKQEGATESSGLNAEETQNPLVEEDTPNVEDNAVNHVETKSSDSVPAKPNNGKKANKKPLKEQSKYVSEMPEGKRVGKVKMTEFVSDDVRRKGLVGVYHDSEGYAVASDTSIIVAVKSEYNPDLEGQIVDKKANVIDKEFPKWERALPIGEPDVTVPITKWDIEVANGITSKKSEDEWRRPHVRVLTPDGKTFIFAEEVWKKFMRAAKLVGATEIELRHKTESGTTFYGSSVFAKGENGMAYAMGVMSDNTSDNTNDARFIHKLGEGAKMSLSEEQSAPPFGLTEVERPEMDKATARVVAAAERAGLKVRFFEGPRGQQGVYYDGTIWVNRNATKDSKAFIAGHELNHAIFEMLGNDAKAKEAYVNAAMDVMRGVWGDDFDAKYAQMRDMYIKHESTSRGISLEKATRGKKHARRIEDIDGFMTASKYFLNTPLNTFLILKWNKCVYRLKYRSFFVNL